MNNRPVVSLAAVLFFIMMAWGRQVWGAMDCGEPVPAPKYQAGERWTWRDEKGREGMSVVLQVEGDMTQIRLLTGDVASYDKDWIIQKVVRTTGEVVTTQGAGATVTARVGQKTLDFPLQVGKQWEISAYAQARSGLGTMERFYERYKVVACEEVATPAGKLPAMKVEVERGMTGTQPRAKSGAPPTGVYYLWYAPQVKNIVRLQYVPSQWWSGGHYLNTELIKFEGR
jgi:hypothetical protein